MDILTVEEVREELRFLVSRSWVYAHWRELGATKIGGKLIFTREGLNHALQGSRQVDGNSPGKREAEIGQLRHEKGGQGLGGGNQEATAYLKSIGVI